MYLPRAENIPSPYFAIENAISDITPTGDVSITISKSWKKIALRVLMKFIAGLPFSPDIIIAIENKMVNIITGSIFPSAIAISGLSGNIFIKKSVIDGVVTSCSKTGAFVKTTFCPGLIA